VAAMVSGTIMFVAANVYHPLDAKALLFGLATQHVLAHAHLRSLEFPRPF